MSGLLAVLIFGVGYPIAALATACVGTFGVAANRHDPERNWTPAAELLVVFIAAVLWPVAMPLWISWRKGSFIADALEKRNEQIRLDKAAS